MPVASWLQDNCCPLAIMSSFKQGGKERIRETAIHAWPCLSKKPNFSRSAHDRLSLIPSWPEYSHVMSSFAFWILSRLGNERVKKIGGSELRELREFLPCSSSCPLSRQFWQWPHSPITTAPARHPPPWLQLCRGSSKNTSSLAFLTAPRCSWCLGAWLISLLPISL